MDAGASLLPVPTGSTESALTSSSSPESADCVSCVLASSPVAATPVTLVTSMFWLSIPMPVARLLTKVSWPLES